MESIKLLYILDFSIYTLGHVPSKKDSKIYTTGLYTCD
jgi:hypothetical protein